MDEYRPRPDDTGAWQDRDPERERRERRPAPPPPAPVQPYQQSYPQARPVVLVPAKTPGLAVLFSFLWLGAGNCYAGQVGLGVTLIVAQVVCAPVAAFLASITFGLSLVVTVPIWLVAFAVSAATGYSRCTEHNRSLGLHRY
ncbi:hypothetical protein [Kineococcus sp. SYSU DK002]|uniref:hypothetical protein n=1 Tax=Kineococcus sp. SYSU DK002 TaxID=3383123 RepID=UPI003D7C68DF